MKTFILTVIIIILSVSFVFSQSVSGTVKNEKGENVEFATIVMTDVKDTTKVVAYALSGNNGQYKIEVPNPGDYWIKVKSLGLVDIKKQISLTSNEKITQFNFFMAENTEFLDEVEIKARATGIKYREDTISYDPKVFVDGSEIVLGDVLKKLPGIEVEEGGSVKAMGKNVEKVLVDGKDFFGGNTQVAVNNLPADVAENVEVLNNYSEYSLLEGFKSSEQTVINVGVNKEKFGKISGNLSAGGGIEDKYYARGNIMQLKPKYMLSFLGALNNTGEPVFDFQDYIKLQGGITEFMNNEGNGSFSLQLSEEESRLLAPVTNTYAKADGLSALNFSYQPKSDFKLNSYILFNKNKIKSENFDRYTYNIPFGDENTSESRSDAVSKNNMLSAYLKLNYEPFSTLNMIYSGFASGSAMNTRLNSFNRMGTDEITGRNKELLNSLSTKHNFVLMKSVKKHLLMAEANFDYSNRPGYYDIKTDSLLLPLSIPEYEGWYYARQNKRTESLDGKISMSFLYKINNKYFMKFFLSENANIVNFRTDISSDLPSGDSERLEPDSLRNNISLRVNDFNAGINLTKNKGMFRFKAGATAHFYDLGRNVPDLLDQNKKFVIIPTAEISLHLSERQRISLSFSENILKNQVSAFANALIFNNSSSYSKNEHKNRLFSNNYNISLFYMIFDNFSNTSFNINGAFMKSENALTYDYYQYGLLTQYRTIISPLQERIYAGFFFSKGFDFPWTVKLNGRYSSDSYFNKISGEDNRIKVNSTGGKIEITSDYRKLFDTELSASINYSNNRSTLNETAEQMIQRYSGKLKLNIKDKIFAYVELEYVINDYFKRKQELYYLNASIRYTLNKKLEFEIIGQNMLNLFRQEWSELVYNANYILEHHYRQIPGNILLKVNWKF